VIVRLAVADRAEGPDRAAEHGVGGDQRQQRDARQQQRQQAEGNGDAAAQCEHPPVTQQGCVTGAEPPALFDSGASLKIDFLRPSPY
jgi:hypothetical protein